MFVFVPDIGVSFSAQKHGIILVSSAKVLMPGTGFHSINGMTVCH